MLILDTEQIHETPTLDRLLGDWVRSRKKWWAKLQARLQGNSAAEAQADVDTGRHDSPGSLIL
jgi:hypothetical protein